jgi:diguanylate cyclase (GGDEF)-like protein
VGSDDDGLVISQMDDSADTNTRPAVPLSLATDVRRNRACLVVLAGTHTGEMFELGAERTVIGRGATAAVRLQDDGVSREHAAIGIQGARVVLEDLGSTNGTFCNGVRVTSQELADGDKIMLGSTTVLKFSYQDYLDEMFQRQLLESALRDSLTKAFNKKYFSDLLDKEFSFALRHCAPLALLFIDLDHFKRINDTVGHPAGDFVLAEVSGVLAGAIRHEDVLARFGGEEFCVLCRGTDAEGARVLGERLRRDAEQRRHQYGESSIQVTISVGGAVMPDPAFTEPALLLAAADKALYEAKRAGRNRVVIARRSDSPR